MRRYCGKGKVSALGGEGGGGVDDWGRNMI